LLSFRTTGRIDALRQLRGTRYIQRFRKNEIPDYIQEVTVQSPDGVLGIVMLLRAAGLIASNGKALRMIQRNAVHLDDERFEDRALEIPAGDTHVCQEGKRKFAKVRIV
jgi:tyrosyl-tRNA synthetase